MRIFDQSRHAPDDQPAEAPLGAFEENLLTDLKVVIAERATAPALPSPEVPRPARRVRVTGRTVAAGAVAVALAAGLATAVTVADSKGGAASHPSPGQAQLDAFLNGAASHVRGQLAPVTSATDVRYTLGVNGWSGPEIGSGRNCYIDWMAYATRRNQEAEGHGSRCPSVIPIPLAWRALQTPLPPGVRYGHTYPALSTLPVSPGALLTALDRDAGRGEKYWNAETVNVGHVVSTVYSFAGPQVVRNYVAFTLIERLLQAPVSGRLRAALFQAVERIPGVSLDRNTVDEAGRPGVGIVLSSPVSPDNQFGGGTNGEAVEFILQAGTYRFLGEGWRWWAKFPHQPQQNQTQQAAIAVIRTGVLTSDSN
jgi:hypothetical protein